MFLRIRRRGGCWRSENLIAVHVDVSRTENHIKVFKINKQIFHNKQNIKPKYKNMSDLTYS